MKEETKSHLFYYCTHIQDTLNQYQTNSLTVCIFHCHYNISTAIFGFHNFDNDTFLIQSHKLLLLKLHWYSTRKCKFICFSNLLNEISKIKNLKRRVALNNGNEYKRFRKKWHRIENKVPQDFVPNKQKNFFHEPKDLGVLWQAFLSFLFILMIVLYI